MMTTQTWAEYQRELKKRAEAAEAEVARLTSERDDYKDAADSEAKQADANLNKALYQAGRANAAEARLRAIREHAWGGADKGKDHAVMLLEIVSMVDAALAEEG